MKGTGSFLDQAKGRACSSFRQPNGRSSRPATAGRRVPVSSNLNHMSIHVHFPAIAVSPAGWVKTGKSLDELTDAAPSDDLRQWQGLRVFDADGNAYLASRVERRWPTGRIGLARCRLTNVSTYVRLELQPEVAVSVSELAAMLTISESLPQGTVWSSQRELVEFVCQ